MLEQRKEKLMDTFREMISTIHELRNTQAVLWDIEDIILQMAEQQGKPDEEKVPLHRLFHIEYRTSIEDHWSTYKPTTTMTHLLAEIESDLSGRIISLRMKVDTLSKRINNIPKL